VRLKEAGLAREILAVSFGPKATQVGQCLLSSFHSLNQINRNPLMGMSNKQKEEERSSFPPPSIRGPILCLAGLPSQRY